MKKYEVELVNVEKTNYYEDVTYSNAWDEESDIFDSLEEAEEKISAYLKDSKIALCYDRINLNLLTYTDEMDEFDNPELEIIKEFDIDKSIIIPKNFVTDINLPDNIVRTSDLESETGLVDYIANGIMKRDGFDIPCKLGYVIFEEKILPTYVFIDEAIVENSKGETTHVFADTIEIS